MKCTTTKTMVKELQKRFPTLSFSLIEKDTGWFDDSRDYNPKTGKTKFIKVVYPDEFYAMPRFLSTKDLEEGLRKSDRTLEGFLNAMESVIAI